MTISTESARKKMELASAALLPCPLCGQDITLRKIEESWGYSPGYLLIECDPCGISTRKLPTERWEPGRGHFDTHDEAIVKLVGIWNARALPGLPNDNAAEIVNRVLEADKAHTCGSSFCDGGWMVEAYRKRIKFLSAGLFDSATKHADVAASLYRIKDLAKAGVVL